MSQVLNATVRSGDLLLFSGRGLSSWLVRMFTRSRWSHIGMVVELPGHPQPLLLESTLFNESADVVLGRPVAGVVLVSLAEKLDNYKGDVALRRRCGSALGGRQQRLLEKMLARLMHRPYKHYLLCHLLEYLGGGARRQDLSGLFCSELVAEIYRRLGWLPGDIRASNFVPGHFAGPALALREGHLGELVLLKGAGSCAKASGEPCRDTVAIARQTAGHGRLLPPQSHGGQSPRSPAAA